MHEEKQPGKSSPVHVQIMLLQQVQSFLPTAARRLLTSITDQLQPPTQTCFPFAPPAPSLVSKIKIQTLRRWSSRCGYKRDVEKALAADPASADVLQLPCFDQLAENFESKSQTRVLLLCITSKRCVNTTVAQKLTFFSNLH